MSLHIVVAVVWVPFSSLHTFILSLANSRHSSHRNKVFVAEHILVETFSPTLAVGPQLTYLTLHATAPGCHTLLAYLAIIHSHPDSYLGAKNPGNILKKAGTESHVSSSQHPFWMKGVIFNLDLDTTGGSGSLQGQAFIYQQLL